MQRIIPSIWFDRVAEEAVGFYTSAFPGGRVLGRVRYPAEGLPDSQAHLAGETLQINFELAGHRFAAINAGPEFPVNPSVSFLLNFDPAVDADAAAHLDRLWGTLAEGGTVLMELGEYGFAPRYGWVADPYGVTWQLVLTDPDAEPRPFILPSLLFGGGVQNRAREAIDFYTSVFGGRIGTYATYPDATGPAEAGGVMFADFLLGDQWFAAMDSAAPQDFSFSCGVSFAVACADQAEIDRLWEQLSAVPEAEQCGWCLDRFGLSWQVLPADLSELLARPNAYATLLRQKKIDLSAFGR